MTKWFSCLHLVVLLPFSVLLFLFLCVFHSSQKDPPKPDTAKPPKTKMQKKNGQQKNQLAQLCSQIVFLNFWEVGLKISVFAESTIKIVVSASFVKGKHGPQMPKRLSPNLVQGWVKTWPKHVAQQVLTQKSGNFRPLFLFILFSNLVLHAKRRILKNKSTTNKENLDQILTQTRAIFGPNFDSTAYILRPICCLLFWAETTFFAFSGEKEEDLRTKHAFLARFATVLVSIFWGGPFLPIKMGTFWDFWPTCRLQTGLMPYVWFEPYSL